MSLKELITSARDKTSDVKSDEVDEIFSSIETEVNNLSTSNSKLQEANTSLKDELENEKNKVHKRNEENASNRWDLKAKNKTIADLNNQITNLKNGGAEDVNKLKSDILEQDKSLETLTKKLKRKTVRDKSLLINKLSAIEDQEIITKIEKVLPIEYDTEAEEPSFKFDDLTDEQIDTSLDKISELEVLGVLKPIPVNKPGATPPNKKFNPNRYTGEELEILAEKHPDEYAKLRKQKGFFE